MNETYQNWVERVAADRESKPLSAGDVVKTPAAEPFGAVEFVKLDKTGFKAEVGKKGQIYIFHFFPEEKNIWMMKEPLTNAFIEVYKNPEQIEMDWVEEFQSFAMRVRGWGSNVWGDELALRAINLTEQLLAERAARLPTKG